MDIVYVGVTILFFILCGLSLRLFGKQDGQNGREG